MLEFSSNQVFEITGDNRHDRNLKSIIKFLMTDFKFTPECCKVTDDGVLEFYLDSSCKHLEIEDVYRISSDDRNSDYYFSIIQLYLNSSKYKNRFKSIVNKWVKKDPCGSFTEGWKISVRSDGLFLRVFVVEPYMCYWRSVASVLAED